MPCDTITWQYDLWDNTTEAGIRIEKRETGEIWLSRIEDGDEVKCELVAQFFNDADVAKFLLCVRSAILSFEQ